MHWVKHKLSGHIRRAVSLQKALKKTFKTKTDVEQTWKAGPPSAEFIILHPPMNAKRNNLLKITSVAGSSTKLSKFFTQGGDSSTFFFNLLFKLIFVFLLFMKLAMRIFSKAASIDSSLLSCPAYCCKRKLRELQISSSDASGGIPRRL